MMKNQSRLGCTNYMVNFNVYTEINETLACTEDLIEVEIPSTFFLKKNAPILVNTCPH